MKAFYRALGLLSGGTLAGQLILFGTAPVLTRLYDAEAFGIFAVVTSIAMLVGLVGSLRYELALPLVHDEGDAASLFALCLVLGATTGIGFLLVTWLGARVFESVFLGQDPVIWQGLAPAIVVLYDISIVLEYWSLRRRNVRVNAIMRIVFIAGQVAVQISCGLLGMNSKGLILGILCGHLLRVIGFTVGTDAWSALRLHRPTVETVTFVAREYWRFPVFAAPANLLLEIVQLAPVSLVAVVYDARTAGLFGVAQRILEAPVRLLSHSASLLFLREAANLSSADVMSLFRTIVLRFALLGSVGMLPIATFGPPMFELLFGEPWREAGRIAQLLLPFQLMRFVTGAVGNALTLHQRNDLQCLTASLAVVAMCATFAAGWLMELSSYTTIAIFAITTASTYGLQLLAAWWVVRAVQRTDPSARPVDSHAAHGPTD